jgi:Ca2+-binding RTX toxin-like protein
MTVALNLADLFFLQTQVIFGAAPPPGTDPFSLLGIRALDGSNNNLTHLLNLDQHGQTVDTDTFGVVNQPFFNIYGRTSAVGTAVTPYSVTYAPGTDVSPPISDSSPRVISNLIADMNPLSNPAAATATTVNTGQPAFFIPPTNSLFTFFGQFFDHGLDFIDKGGSGSILIEILPGDPLYNPNPGAFNFMPVDRATLYNSVTGEIWDPANPQGGVPVTNNSTAPLVEQSQTYGQTENTVFFLKEYYPSTHPDFPAQPTGRLVTHADGGMATWQDVKDNVLNAFGLVLTDEHALNIPEVIWNGTSYELGAGTGQAFLADIAHTANPTGKLADLDDQLGLTGASNTYYDDELLDAHKIAGDPRANENTALTAIHDAFHSEHNRIVLVLEDLIKQQDQITPGTAEQWDGERIFQAAKLVNEMQYQHFVFEEFARRMSPNVDAFAQYDVTINPNISAEFSQAVYRLGHSMLTDTVKSVNAADQISDMTLVEAFLNPVAFETTGAGALIEGATRDTMNEIDEFVVDSLRNMLLGLSLDLAAINIARGRDVGLPTLNQLREQLYADTGEGSLVPYTSWADFGANLLHPESLVNFIAAYSRDSAIIAARADGDNALARSLATAKLSDATFMNGGDQGFWDIDLWIGGLAEAKAVGPLGNLGMLGSTFDFIFATQLRALQDGDRFYYLARLGGTNILAEIEQSTFGDLFERGSGARHTNGDIFSVANEYVELSATDVTTFTSLAGDWIEVIGGTTRADTIRAGAGNDTVWGEDGNDTIYGDGGNDHLYGNAGDDTIFGGSGFDFIRGDDGNDALNGDAGDDLIFGKTGNDVLRGGAGVDLLEGGLGNDTLEGGDQDDTLVGQENDDILRGGLGNDALDGGSGNDFLQGDRGNDTLAGFEGDDVLDGGAGADVLDGGLLGHDIASYQSSSFGLTIDLALPANSTGDATGDTYVDIEEVLGTQFDDIIIGDALDNILSGGGAINGDKLDGGDGNDVLYSNEGKVDNLIGGLGVDQAIFLGRTHLQFSDFTTTVDTLGNGFIQEVNPGPALGAIDTLTGVEELVFDDGIWSTVTRQWVPLVGVDASAPLQVNGVLVDGTFVNTTALLDNTSIPLNGIKLGNIQVADIDGVNGVRTVTLGGPDAASFRINNGPLGPELYFMGGRTLGFAKVNFEAKDRYEIAITVADNSGGSAITYMLNVTDVNDNAPLLTSPDHIVVGSDVASTTVIYRATATDLDTVTNVVPSATVTNLQYSLAAPGVGNNNNLFTMSNNGEVKIAGALNAGTYILALLASDGVNATPKIITVTVTGTLIADGIFTTGNDTVDLNTFNLSLYTQGAATNALAGNDTVTLSDTQNIGILFNGSAGSDTINGSVNSDTIDGGTENDRLNGGVGNDTIEGGLGVDTAIFTGRYTGFSVTGYNDDGSFVYTDTNLTDGNQGSDTLSGIERISNTLGGDWLVVLGTSGSDNLVTTIPWWGIMNGGAGDDSLTGGNGNDWLGGASGIDTINGGAGNDTIDGGSDNDTLIGGAGNDAIHGGTGDDTIDGGTENDRLNGGVGNDTIEGGLGVDTAIFTGRYTGFSVTGYNDDGSFVYTDTNLTDGNQGSDTLSGIERISNTLGGDWLVVLGTSGSDNLITTIPWWGIMNGGAGDDSLTGGNGNDWLGGASGIDTINGGAGNDTIDGGSDNDTLIGGSGNDRFVFTAGWGQDTISDFNSSGDLIDLSALGVNFASLVITSINGNADTEIAIVGDALNTITLSGVNAVTIAESDFDLIA